MKAREQRMAVNFAARMRADGEWFNVSVRDMSSHGLLVKPSTAVSQRTYVELQRGNQTVIGRVVWSEDGQLGLRSQDRIDINDMMRSAQRGGIARATTAAAIEPQTPSADQIRRNIANQVDRSQAFGRNFQFIVIGAAGVSACTILAMLVVNVLGKAFAATMAALGG